MARATQAYIDLSAIEHNYVQAKAAGAGAQAFAVIKANAYGHGLVPVARRLASIADGLAVACVDEALELKNAAIEGPIMVLEGPYNQAECQLAAASGLELVLHSKHQFAWIEQLNQPISIWLKVDTGMHRLGLSPADMPAIIDRLKALPVQHDLQLMSHFACSDEPANPFNQQQLDCFLPLAKLGLPWSLSNSAAILQIPQAHGQRIRPGIMLYGATPIVDKPAVGFGLKPVMTLQSDVIAVHDLVAGDTVGYGQTWLAEKDCRIAVVAIGYGDGYPRQAPNGTPVLINGQRASMAGRVSMDMITVDVTELDDVSVGDEVILWGEGLPADEIALLCQTIAYELFCQVTPRVPRKYHS